MAWSAGLHTCATFRSTGRAYGAVAAPFDAGLFAILLRNKRCCSTRATSRPLGFWKGRRNLMVTSLDASRVRRGPTRSLVAIYGPQCCNVYKDYFLNLASLCPLCPVTDRSDRRSSSWRRFAIDSSSTGTPTGASTGSSTGRAASACWFVLAGIMLGNRSS